MEKDGDEATGIFHHRRRKSSLFSSVSAAIMSAMPIRGGIAAGWGQRFAGGPERTGQRMRSDQDAQGVRGLAVQLDENGLVAIFFPISRCIFPAFPSL